MGTEFDIAKAAEIAKHWEHYEGVWELGCLGCFEQLTALVSSPAPDAGLRAALEEIADYSDEPASRNIARAALAGRPSPAPAGLDVDEWLRETDPTRPAEDSSHD